MRTSLATTNIFKFQIVRLTCELVNGNFVIANCEILCDAHTVLARIHEPKQARKTIKNVCDDGNNDGTMDGNFLAKNKKICYFRQDTRNIVRALYTHKTLNTSSPQPYSIHTHTLLIMANDACDASLRINRHKLPNNFSSLARLIPQRGTKENHLFRLSWDFSLLTFLNLCSVVRSFGLRFPFLLVINSVSRSEELFPLRMFGRTHLLQIGKPTKIPNYPVSTQATLACCSVTICESRNDTLVGIEATTITTSTHTTHSHNNWIAKLEKGKTLSAITAQCTCNTNCPHGIDEEFRFDYYVHFPWMQSVARHIRNEFSLFLFLFFYFSVKHLHRPMVQSATAAANTFYFSDGLIYSKVAQRALSTTLRSPWK